MIHLLPAAQPRPPAPRAPPANGRYPGATCQPEARRLRWAGSGSAARHGERAQGDKARQQERQRGGQRHHLERIAGLVGVDDEQAEARCRLVGQDAAGGPRVAGGPNARDPVAEHEALACQVGARRPGDLGELARIRGRVVALKLVGEDTRAGRAPVLRIRRTPL